MVKDTATKAEFGVISKLVDFKNYDINSQIMKCGVKFWGHRDLQKIEKINLHFYKFILGVKQSTADNAVYGDLGRRPLLCRYK